MTEKEGLPPRQKRPRKHRKPGGINHVRVGEKGIMERLTLIAEILMSIQQDQRQYYQWCMAATYAQHQAQSGKRPPEEAPTEAPTEAGLPPIPGEQSG